LGDLSLELGATAETVTVQAEIAMLQTQSAERSGIITGTQTVNLALNGRNYLDLIKTVPGVVSDFNGQVAGPGGIGAIYVNGQRGNQNNLTLDGATNMDTGSNGTQHTSLNIDAVAEFRVLTNGQQAEFGRSAGAAINIVTKGGTQDFHGTGYWFHRHEGLNANNWRNNRDGLPRRYYRYNYQGYNVGGPVYVPGKFNKDKDKLFFFFGQEFQRQLVPNTTRFVTVPTPDQRNGDFSNTRDAAGVLQTIVDPLNNRQPFPGGRIPASRFSADGQKILNFYPLPNVSGQPSYNFQSQESSGYPRRQEIYRIDWNINQKWRAFFRVINDKDEQFMPYGQWSADYNIPFGKMRFAQPGHSAIANLTTVLNPTLTNEFIFGPSRNRLTIDPTSDAFSRAKLGLAFRLRGSSQRPLYRLQRHSLPQRQQHLRFQRQPEQGIHVPPRQDRFLHPAQPQGPDGVHPRQRQHLVQPRCPEPRRHQLGLCQCPGRQLPALPASQRDSEWSVPVYERGVVHPGQLEDPPRPDPRLRDALLPHPAAV
jgi:hypothetical protein